MTKPSWFDTRLGMVHKQCSAWSKLVVGRIQLRGKPNDIRKTNTALTYTLLFIAYGTQTAHMPAAQYFYTLFTS